MSLTNRQFEVLKLIAEGYNNVEIGEKLFISSNVVAEHCHLIFLRLGARNRTQAVHIAHQKGILNGGTAHTRWVDIE